MLVRCHDCSLISSPTQAILCIILMVKLSQLVTMTTTNLMVTVLIRTLTIAVIIPVKLMQGGGTTLVALPLTVLTEPNASNGIIFTTVTATLNTRK